MGYVSLPEGIVVNGIISPINGLTKGVTGVITPPCSALNTANLSRFH